MQPALGSESLGDSPPLREILCHKNHDVPVPTAGILECTKKDTTPGVIHLMPRKTISGKHSLPTTVVSPDNFCRRKRPMSSIDSVAHSSNFECSATDPATSSRQEYQKTSDTFNMDSLSLYSPVARLANTFSESLTPPRGKHSKSKDSLTQTPQNMKLVYSRSPQKPSRDQTKVCTRDGCTELSGLHVERLVATPPTFHLEEEHDNDEEMAFLATSPGMALYVERAARNDKSFSDTPKKVQNSSPSTPKTPSVHPSSMLEMKRTPLRKLNLTPRKTPRRSTHGNLFSDLTETVSSTSSMITSVVNPLDQRYTVSKNEESCSMMLASSPPPEQVSVSSNQVCPPRPAALIEPSKMHLPCYVMFENRCDNKSFASDISHFGDLYEQDDGFVLTSPQVLLEERSVFRESYDSQRNTRQRRY
mmetsp:Transcript_14787/g.23129  ORF Transcript_14787/g.23129 Transcript_14787/m.23129 type:complete len:418 (+) Transcript_14787:135-1388(+)